MSERLFLIETGPWMKWKRFKEPIKLRLSHMVEYSKLTRRQFCSTTTHAHWMRVWLNTLLLSNIWISKNNALIHCLMLFVNKLNAMFVALNFIIQIDWRIIYSRIMPMLTQFTCSFVGILTINSFLCGGIEFVLYWFSSPTNHITFYGLIRQFCENIRDDFMHRTVCSAFDFHFNRMAHSDKNFQLMPYFLVFFIHRWLKAQPQEP